MLFHKAFTKGHIGYKPGNFIFGIGQVAGAAEVVGVEEIP
jgi:hypothetical protein